MEVQVNQQATAIPGDTPLYSLLDQRGLTATKGIAVAVNDSIIPRSRWEHHILQPHDKIIIIRATQGG